MTEFVSEAEPPSSRIGRSVDDRYAEVAYLNVCGVTGIGAKREGKSQQPQALRNRLKIQQRTVRLPCFRAYVAGKVFGVLEALRCLARRGALSGRQQVAAFQEGHVSRREFQGAVKGAGEPAYRRITAPTDNRDRRLGEEPVDWPVQGIRDGY